MNSLRPKPPEISVVKKLISERDERIINAYEAQGDEPHIPRLAEQLGVTPQTVRNVLRRHQIKPLSKGNRGRKIATRQTTLTPVHARIAQVLRTIYANYELETGSNPQITVIADHIGLAKSAYSEILSGRRDARLSELTLIAKAAKISLPELLTVKWIPNEE